MSGHEPDLDLSESLHPQQLQQQPQHPQQHQLQHQIQPAPSSTGSDAARKPKAPSVRRACVACHSGKTRCSEVLPCQNCIKRGLGSTCAYPDPETEQQQQHERAAAAAAGGGATSTFPATPAGGAAAYAAAQGGLTLSHQQYYDYNGQFTGASSSTFRPAKRARTLTEEETAAITRNFSRGDFFVGNSAPVRIDPRLPVRLTLGEGDHVHFNVGNYDVANP
ncbi:hypothetical protein C8J57DRAFT_1703666 [Mycena rebaudengoi]|nr:hypothetical protein C8J57DRAFT_1703666 [Mycena rebaudengoi]